MTPECVIFVGLQGSGKTTFYRQRFERSHRHVSKDDFPNARNRRARQRALMESVLDAGESCVVDNTNATPEERAEPIAVARSRGARVIGYFFDTSTRAAVARNRLREGRARVPDVAIFTTARRLVPPAWTEGFDELYRVVLDEGGDFQLTALERQSI